MNFLIKVILILCIYPSLIVSVSSSSTQQLPPAHNLTININAASNNNPNNTLTANQKSSQEVTHTHTHVTKIDWPAVNWPTFNWPDLKMSSIQNKVESYYDNFWNYKWYVLAGCATASCLCLNFKIYHINKLLEDPKSWCLWKEEIPLTRLTTIDAAELLKQLKIDVCKKYFKTIDAIKDSELLVRFLEDVTHEKNLLEFYQSIYNFSNTLYISKLFMINKTTEQISQYIARLNFLMDLYLEKYIQTNTNFNNN
jgi:hypothetical protein